MIKFIYDAEGIRKVKIEDGVEVKYLMDGLAVLCEYDGSGNIKREYVPGISMKENGKTYYYITDRLGNVRYILDENGNSIQSYTYSPFGKIHTSSGSLNQPYQYVGEEFYYTEGDIGLKLLGQRWYDSGVGRFISRDPVFSVTLYSYVQNEPVDEVDPEGLKKKEKKQKSGWNITKVRWYGNWCGPGWSGGEFPLPGKTKWNVSAIDPLDECCKKHDACFQGYDLINHKYLPKEKRKSKEECNKEFCKCLENIDKCELIEAGGVGKLEGMKRFFCK